MLYGKSAARALKQITLPHCRFPTITLFFGNLGMALVSCRECAKEVSTEAKNCPHCGASKPSQSKNAGNIGKGIGLILFGGIAIWLYSAWQTDERLNSEHPGYHHTADGALYPTDCSITARQKMSVEDKRACVRYGSFDFSKPLYVLAGSLVCASSDELSLAERGSPARCAALPETIPATELTVETMAQHMQVRLIQDGRIMDGWVSNHSVAN